MTMPRRTYAARVAGRLQARLCHARVIPANYHRRQTRMRVSVLTNILPPYRIGFYNELAGLCDLHVVLDAMSTPDRQWEIDRSSVRFRCTVSDNWHKAVERRGAGYASERRFFNFS